jgi:hypothetical protein
MASNEESSQEASVLLLVRGVSTSLGREETSVGDLEVPLLLVLKIDYSCSTLAARFAARLYQQIK